MRRIIAVLNAALLALIGASVTTTAQQTPSALSAAQQLMLVPASKYPGRVHVLPATLETTQWGWFDNAELPRLIVDSGDTVVVETMSHSHGQLWPGRTIEELKKLRTDWPGRGPMSLTGPIYVNGAEPGDTLLIKIQKIIPRPWGANFNIPGMFGQFPKQFPDGQVKYFYIDIERKIAEFAPGIEIPLRPFPGTLGVARAEPGRYNAVPPGPFAGNLDNRDLVEGTTLYVPVFVRGALVWTGDSHAAQGNGEVNLTAMETAFQEITITVTVDKTRTLQWPRIEAPTEWITMGFDEDLNKALANAKAETGKLLAEQRKLPADEAVALVAKVADCRVTQVVDIKKGIHCITSKDAQKSLAENRPSAETPEYLVTHVADADINKAMDAASWSMIELLQKERTLSRLDAYSLASMTMDCRVGEMEAGEKGVHCLVPKSLWVKR
ncbi:amidase [Bradyrhizobium sp. NAS80.1]|nr:amidase [Bradyrhizobium sp. NAS80.1]